MTDGCFDIGSDADANISHARIWLGSIFLLPRRPCGARRGVRRFSPRCFLPQQSFSHDRDKVLISNTNPDAPTGMNLRDDFATVRETSFQSVSKAFNNPT